jgi:hypothetical protein
VGDDANPCSRTAPCKTFAGAISKTAAGGEIDVLDPGGFGGITITKSITLDGSGANGEAGVLVSGTNGIVISAPGANVILRNLDIEGLGTGVSGIFILDAANVYIENVRIDAFVGGAGILIQPQTGATNVFVKNSIVRNCGGTASGLLADGGTMPVSVDADHLSVHNCPTGVTAQNGAKVSARNAEITGNPIGVATGGSTGTLISLDTTLVSFSSTAGLSSTVAGGTIRISNCSILDNGGRGILTSGGGAVISFVNNRINGNNPDGAPTSSIYQK